MIETKCSTRYIHTFQRGRVEIRGEITLEDADFGARGADGTRQYIGAKALDRLSKNLRIKGALGHVSFNSSIRIQNTQYEDERLPDTELLQFSCDDDTRVTIHGDLVVEGDIKAGYLEADNISSYHGGIMSHCDIIAHEAIESEDLIYAINVQAKTVETHAGIFCKTIKADEIFAYGVVMAKEMECPFARYNVSPEKIGKDQRTFFYGPLGIRLWRKHSLLLDYLKWKENVEE